ncbi:MAG: hypothetical protein LAP21_20525 [Acidobacteriia bacterium]|nr:hypothetical protein [Terriglobia bacterium]
MTPTPYEVLFRIECLHGYFGGKACRSLNLSPTEDCRALLRRYQMLFRATEGGGTVYAIRQPPSGLLRGFDESAPFTFTLTSTDPALDAYTETDSSEISSPMESLFYFDNTADQQAEVFGERRQLLHAAKNPLAGAAIPVRPSVSNYTPDAKVPDGPLQVLDPLSGQALWQAPAKGGKPVTLELRRLPVGCYRIVMSGKELQKFYLSGRPASQQWGAISIYAGGSRQSAHLPANCQSILPNGDSSLRTFTLALQARKTIWRYYIIDPAGKQEFNSYELTGMAKRTTPPEAAADLSFRRLPDTAPVDGRTACVFESQSPLPLLYSPASEFAFTLRPGGNGKRGDRSIRVPYAQPGTMVKTKRAKQQLWCSEVFVYV